MAHGRARSAELRCRHALAVGVTAIALVGVLGPSAPARADLPGVAPEEPSDGPPVPLPPAEDSGSASEPATTPEPVTTPQPSSPEGTPVSRAFVWGTTTLEVALATSIVLEVAALPPLDDNGPRLLLLMGASLALGAGVGALAAVLEWPEQGSLALAGAFWGAFAFAPFGVLMDGSRSTTRDGLDIGPYTAGAALLGAAVGGVLAPLLLDVHEPVETVALHVAPGAGAFIGALVWVGLLILGAIPDEPRTSSRALVASAGIGGTLGLGLPFALRAIRAANE